MSSGRIRVDTHQRRENERELDHEVKGEDWGMWFYSSYGRDMDEHKR